jgi:hypothetical protein
MWNLISDCDKQLTIHSIVREKVDDSFLVYEIIGVEFDLFKLELIKRDNNAVAEVLHNVLDCQQLIQYHFEVEDVHQPEK